MNIKLILLFLIINVGALAQDRVAETLTFSEFEQKLRATSSPQLLDVRSPQEFAENHIEHAINFYAADEESFLKAASRLKKDQPVFVYSINTGRSNVVAKKLKDEGFTEVYPLPGGLAKWIGAGNPIVSTVKSGLSLVDYNRIVGSDTVVLVDVSSKYCGSCKRLDPIVTEVSESQSIKLMKLELYDNRELASSLDIQSVPTLILYKNNTPVWKKSGSISKDDILEALERNL